MEIVNDTVEEFPSRIDKETLIGVQTFRTKDEFDGNGGYLSYENYRDYISSTRASKTGDKFPKILPKSLKDSVMCFILSIAIRESRKQKMIFNFIYAPSYNADSYFKIFIMAKYNKRFIERICNRFTK